MYWRKAKDGRPRRLPCGAEIGAAPAQVAGDAAELSERDQLLMRVGAAKTDVARVFGFVDHTLAEGRRAGH
jgi:hypothetical protein